MVLASLVVASSKLQRSSLPMLPDGSLTVFAKIGKKLGTREALFLSLAGFQELLLLCSRTASGLGFLAFRSSPPTIFVPKPRPCFASPNRKVILPLNYEHSDHATTNHEPPRILSLPLLPTPHHTTTFGETPVNESGWRATRISNPSWASQALTAQPLSAC